MIQKIKDKAFLESVEERWVELVPWKRRLTRVTLSAFFSFLIFNTPLLFLQTLDLPKESQIVQFVLGFATFMVFSLLITAVSRNRRNLALANKQLVVANKQLEEFSFRDSLTGLYNRRFMREVLERMVSHAKRHGEIVAIIFADVDRLKDINDNFCHLAGDSALITTGNRILHAVRSIDYVFRQGGDEFFVAMSFKDGHSIEKELAVIEENLRSAVSSTPFYFEEISIPLSISLGAHIMNLDNSIDKEIDLVDRLMFEKKRKRKR